MCQAVLAHMTAVAYSCTWCSIQNRRPGIWRYARDLASAIDRAHRDNTVLLCCWTGIDGCTLSGFLVCFKAVVQTCACHWVSGIAPGRTTQWGHSISRPRHARNCWSFGWSWNLSWLVMVVSSHSPVTVMPFAWPVQSCCVDDSFLIG